MGREYLPLVIYIIFHYLADGYSIHGTWERGKLEGKAKLKYKDGRKEIK
jgi:hypothetical protein